VLSLGFVIAAVFLFVCCLVLGLVVRFCLLGLSCVFYSVGSGFCLLFRDRAARADLTPYY
jgi:hypothetical protein